MTGRGRFLFPFVYIILLVPAALGSELRTKAICIVAYIVVGSVINVRMALRISGLLLAAFCTLIPLLLVVQGSACLSPSTALTVVDCITGGSSAVLVNAAVLSSVVVLSTANEWRGSFLTTVNGMYLPRRLKIVTIVAGAMIAEFQRAVTRVHQAFTGRGEATPSISFRNLIALPSMLGIIWASVLSGAVERMKSQWSSEVFWTTYIPTRVDISQRTALADYAVSALSVGVVVLFLIATRR